ncbi:MAG: sugar kinase [Candidatus Omnitrophica bacterium]|nr:sugar kinase [Candidatus Omnitrophota bacterium]
MSILVGGTVAIDTIVTPFSRAESVLGGSATYASLSASFFSPVSLSAAVGTDFSKKQIAVLKSKAIDLSGLEIIPGETFKWGGEYGQNFSDPKTLFTQINVLSEFDPQIPEKYKKSKYLFLANISPEIQIKILNQVKKPKIIACDTMNYWIENTPQQLLRLLKKVDISFINESEAKQLTGQGNLLKAARKILKLGPKVVVIKKGEHGVILVSESDVFAAPGFLLDSIVDPTGAGDTFAGGFIGYLANKNKYDKVSLRQAAVCGSVMATFTVEDFSVRRLSSLTVPEINKRMKKFKKITSF